MFYQHLKGHVEALLFAYASPLAAEKLAQILEIDKENLILLVEELKTDLTNSHRGLFISEVAGGYQLSTKPEFGDYIAKLVDVKETRLSPAAMETLAIVAFKQPVTRQDMENIRGVNVDGVVNTLIERSLIKEVGRKEALGRPILYGTTEEFLQCFGLKNLEELPDMNDFLNIEQK